MKNQKMLNAGSPPLDFLAAERTCFCGGRDWRAGAHYETKWGPVELVRCRQCTVDRLRDFPSAERMRSFYEGSKAYWPDNDAAWHAKQKQFEHIPSDLAALGAGPGAVLDVGCNTGYALAVMKRAGWSVTGVEKNPPVAQQARERLAAVIVDDLSEIPAGKQQVVIASHVIEHIDDPVGFCRALKDKLAPGGRLYIKVPNAGSWLVRYWYRERWNAFLPLQHLWYFNARSLRVLLEHTGFEVELLYTRKHISYTAPGKLRQLARLPLAVLHRLVPHDGEEVVAVGRVTSK